MSEVYKVSEPSGLVSFDEFKLLFDSIEKVVDRWSPLVELDR